MLQIIRKAHDRPQNFTLSKHSIFICVDCCKRKPEDIVTSLVVSTWVSFQGTEFLIFALMTFSNAKILTFTEVS